MTDPVAPLTAEEAQPLSAFLQHRTTCASLLGYGMDGDQPTAPFREPCDCGLDAARSVPDNAALREALGSFGERLAAAGYGWEAIITREGPTGEETVAHLTTANPDPAALAAAPASPAGLDE